MKRIILALVAYVCCSSAWAISMMEGNRVQVQVIYDEDITAKITCPSDNEKDCRININFKGEKYLITQATIGKKYPIYPGELRMYYNLGTDYKIFSVAFQTDCGEYSEAQQYYICVAKLYMENGKPMQLTISKRELPDDSVIERIDLSK